MNVKLAAIVLGSSIAVAMVLPNAQARQDKILDGCYVPVSGYARSSVFLERDETGVPVIEGNLPIIQQLGQYQAIFERTNWNELPGWEKSRLIQRFVLDGPFRGKCNPEASDPCASVNHVLGSSERVGFLYTGGDVAIPTAPPVVCDDQGDVVLTVEETLFPVLGDGAFEGLDTDADNSFTVEGTINQCTGLNDFDVIRGGGQICFSSED